jgi:CBS domain-containing protein
MGVSSREPPPDRSIRVNEFSATMSGLLRRLDEQTGPSLESANAWFLQAMVALESMLQELSSGGHRRREEGFAELINTAPLSHGEKELLHDMRHVRNALVHNADVHVGKSFARTALIRLQQIGDRLSAGSVMAASLMTRDVLTIPHDEPLAQVQAILLRRRISQVAVVASDSHVLGWVTHRSLLRALSQKALGQNAGALPATVALAERGVVAISSQTALDRMVTLFEDPDVQSLAVMDGELLQGIVTRSDLLRVAL